MRAILMFHSVDSSGSVLSIKPDELRSLMAAIERSGHRIVPLQDLLDSETGGREIALTFDDGMRSLHQHALPILRDRGAPATVFLISDYVGRDNRWPSMPANAPTMEMMSWDEVDELHAAGWAVEGHTATHPDLRELSDDGILEELQRGDDVIEARLGRRPEIFAYPYGHLNDRVRAVVSGCYRYAVTTEMNALRGRVGDAHRVPRLETYYFREPRIHARFGTAMFSGYLAARAALRRLRRG
jgi:peptidoglycan/xylan/chitin deacetylase (PgdA/CDA1 family)